jgi:hypothetical protein
MKSGVAGLEVEQPGFDAVWEAESVQLANHISTTHDAARLPGLSSAGVKELLDNDPAL